MASLIDTLSAITQAAQSRGVSPTSQAMLVGLAELQGFGLTPGAFDAQGAPIESNNPFGLRGEGATGRWGYQIALYPSVQEGVAAFFALADADQALTAAIKSADVDAVGAWAMRYMYEGAGLGPESEEMIAQSFVTIIIYGAAVFGRLAGLEAPLPVSRGDNLATMFWSYVQAPSPSLSKVLGTPGSRANFFAIGLASLFGVGVDDQAHRLVFTNNMLGFPCTPGDTDPSRCLLGRRIFSDMPSFEQELLSAASAAGVMAGLEAGDSAAWVQLVSHVTGDKPEMIGEAVESFSEIAPAFGVTLSGKPLQPTTTVEQFFDLLMSNPELVSKYLGAPKDVADPVFFNKIAGALLVAGTKTYFGEAFGGNNYGGEGGGKTSYPTPKEGLEAFLRGMTPDLVAALGTGSSPKLVASMVFSDAACTKSGSTGAVVDACLAAYLAGFERARQAFVASYPDAEGLWPVATLDEVKSEAKVYGNKPKDQITRAPAKRAGRDWRHYLAAGTLLAAAGYGGYRYMQSRKAK